MVNALQFSYSLVFSQPVSLRAESCCGRN